MTETTRGADRVEEIRREHEREDVWITASGWARPTYHRDRSFLLTELSRTRKELSEAREIDTKARDQAMAALNTLHHYAEQGEHFDSAYRRIDNAVDKLRRYLEGT